MKLNILYEDGDIIVCLKPAGIASQNERGFYEDMTGILMNYQKKNGIAAPYVGVVHRLDKMVGGVMVYAKHKQAAAKLSQQIAAGKMEKKYYAVICHGESAMKIETCGIMTDYLVRDGRTNTSRISDKNDKMSKRAELRYNILETKTILFGDGTQDIFSLADITLLTGRHHQIRVQFASRNMPLYGDMKYNNMKYNKYHCEEMKQKGPALFSYSIGFIHPVTGKEMSFESKPSEGIFAEFEKIK